MTADRALAKATDVGSDARLQTFNAVCRHGGQREPLERDAGRWSCCPECLPVFDDYGVPINPVSARQHPRAGAPTTQ
jgi:hypothetical protein